MNKATEDAYTKARESADQTIMFANSPGTDSQALAYGMAAVADGLTSLAAAISGAPGLRAPHSVDVTSRKS